METTLLPDLLHRGTGVLIFALAAGLVALHTVLFTLAAQRRAPGGANRLLPATVAAFLALWVGLAISVGDSAGFPLRDDLRPLASLLVSLVPALIAAVVLFASRTVGRVIAEMPPAWLIWAQTYRIAGLMFLYPFLYYGAVPAAFAVPAGVGDFLIAASAPLVGFAVAGRTRHAITWAVVWNLFGILDLIVAPATAVLSQARVLELYPLSLVPLFIGPPLGILTHIYSLRNLALAARVTAGTAQRNSQRPTPNDQRAPGRASVRV